VAWVVPYVEEDSVVVGVAIVGVNPVELLGELDVAHLGAHVGVHVEAHGLAQGLGVVDVMVAIQVQDVGGIGQHGRHTHLQGEGGHTRETKARDECQEIAVLSLSELPSVL